MSMSDGHDSKTVLDRELNKSSDSLDLAKTVLSPNNIEYKNTLENTFAKGLTFADRYEILSEGQRGGMGVVYKCRDTKLKRLSALKLIHPHLQKSSQAIERFRQEVAISLDLQHAHIVRVYDLGESEGREFFTMEWIGGKSLRELILERKQQKRPFSIDEAYRIISQLCEALQYAHRYTIHRDIKPENILLTVDRDELEIKLTDFGIAKMLTTSQFTATSLQMGTPYYMAPEQKLDAGNVDQRADIYSVGVVLFELLTLENTVGPELPTDLNPELPKEIDDVFRKAVALKRENRYGDVVELEQALYGVLQKEEPIDDPSPKIIQAWLSKAQNAIEKDKIEDAIGYYKEVLELDNNYREAKEAKDDLERKIAERKKQEIRLINDIPMAYIPPSDKVRAFWLQTTPVTQKLWQKIIHKSPHCRFKGPDLPVESVSWFSVQEFISIINRVERTQFRLPTEHEWEHAASAGSTEKYHFGSQTLQLKKYAWYAKTRTDRVDPCPRPANAWGLYDVHGNVYEWCDNRNEGDYPQGDQSLTGKGRRDSCRKPIRGGSWRSSASECLVSHRVEVDAGECSDDRGFRLAIDDLPIDGSDADDPKLIPA
jgi:serine/threonine protein kinase